MSWYLIEFADNTKSWIELYNSRYELIFTRHHTDRGQLFCYCITFDTNKFLQTMDEDADQDINILCILCLATTFDKFRIKQYPIKKIRLTKYEALYYIIQYLHQHVGYIITVFTTDLFAWFDQVWDYLQITIEN